MPPARSAVELRRCAPATRRAESYLVRLSRRAMACTFEVFLNAGQYPHGTEAALAALDLVDRLEDQLSVYREDSEISQLNRTAALSAGRCRTAVVRLARAGPSKCTATPAVPSTSPPAGCRTCGVSRAVDGKFPPTKT